MKDKEKARKPSEAPTRAMDSSVCLDKTLVIGVKERDISQAVLPSCMSSRYRILRVLGKGGFGVVYLAEDLRIGRLVAIKQLFERWAKSPEFRDQFMNEAKVAGRLGHPNIVSIFNVEGESASELCIVMEYLGGGSLEDLLSREGRLEALPALRIMMGVLSGLDAAHHMMVVHSDMKPSNILFGVGGVPKIADFGMARSSSKAETLAWRGGTDEVFGLDSSICGTPQYMSPEQASGLPYDCRSDIYSAGAILYRALSGECLLDSCMELDPKSLAKAVAETKPKPLSQFRADIPQEVEDLMLKMLSKDPEARPDSAMSALRTVYGAVARMKDAAASGESPELPFEASSQVFLSPAAILEDIVGLLLVDGVISPPERVELVKRAERLGLSHAQLSAVERRVRLERGLPLES